MKNGNVGWSEKINVCQRVFKNVNAAAAAAGLQLDEAHNLLPHGVVRMSSPAERDVTGVKGRPCLYQR